ncbi:ankyrin repeat domain-containing protein [Wolbachia endosymbiont (group B) of Episyrphus balteatus]|uniref:ankyrin repeat domain-containing protein n=1 Tax=Wolbachia endosymbiont (group B) of Episyrphus balteatus TaxID=2954009 RepID=UPI00222642F1|nr:ankyrin repeat domain-containing protein [Wolbachia endosymbiont (group B) of Episyrphus balteatus]
MESDKNVDYLLNSAGAGDIENVRFYIESCGVDVNSADDIGRTALHRAAYRGRNSIVEYLLSKGANIDSKIECSDPELSGATPLSWAVMSGHVDIVKTLIQRGAKVDVVLNGSNLLGVAVLSDNPFMVELLLNYIPDINGYGHDGETPLIIALGEDKYESTRFLLERGADYRKFDADGHSPLLIAVQEKKGSKYTELLLKHVKEKEGKEGLVEYINSIDSGSGRTALHLACSVQNYHTVKVLLEHGADYRIRDKEGFEPDDLVVGNSHLSYQIRYLFGP